MSDPPYPSRKREQTLASLPNSELTPSGTPRPVQTRSLPLPREEAGCVPYPDERHTRSDKTPAGLAPLPLATAPLRSLLADIAASAATLAGAPRPLDLQIEEHTLAYIAGQAERAQQLLAALDELTRLQQIMPLTDTRPVEVGDLLMRVFARWKPRAPQHTLELALPGKTPTIPADGDLLERALDLLIELLTTLAPPGSAIRAAVRGTGEHVLLTLTGRQARLSDDQLQALLVPGTLTATVLPAVAVAGGLGLAIARMVIEGHGGALQTESNGTQEGLSFLLTLPLRAAPVQANGTFQGPVQLQRGDVAPTLATTAPVPSYRLPFEREHRVILIAEGDGRLARYLRANLAEQRYAVMVAPTVNDALRLIELEEPDLLLVGASLPNGSLLDHYQAMREQTTVPIVLLARTSNPLECAHALDLGATDYLGAPYSLEELLARIRAALRAAEASGRAAPVEPIFSNGELTIDFSQHCVTVNGEEVALSKTEYKLLRVLAQHAGMVLSHEVLLERVWGPGYSSEVEFVWVYIRRLRRKVEPDPRKPRYILTVPGVGYRLARA